ncbi:ferritin-like domain-containing protein [Tahibacter caeni]|uniref:ferritin-like domain-containing protein n=1 Tax=Tahibacter caeni TaxID=1453545 RepID=UPI00214958F0|nr:ferritin-like domain-containing protein [Tahibacter caeni]
MSFLKPAARPWRATDFTYSRVAPAAFDAELLHVLRTTALVESRADQYGDYLRAVFAARGAHWRDAIDQWNREEREHGRALRRLAEAAGGGFAFERVMHAYLDGVAYHACDGRSVRGSIACELVARCIVEALASTFYRVLRDCCRDETGRTVLHALALDEARHCGMFKALLDAECAQRPVSLRQRLRVGLGRMLELSDDQIMFAAWLVDTAAEPHYRSSAVARRYQAALYPRYRYVHLCFAARLICPVLFGRRSVAVDRLFATALWLGLRLRATLSRAALALARRPRRTQWQHR